MSNLTTTKLSQPRFSNNQCYHNPTSENTAIDFHLTVLGTLFICQFMLDMNNISSVEKKNVN